MKKAYIIGTCDTKYVELNYARTLLQARGVPVHLVDVGVFRHDRPVDTTNDEVAHCHPADPAFLERNPARGEAVVRMGEALEAYLSSRDDVGGVLGMGGSGNTSLVSKGMRVLPVGVPKLMVSTVASGDVAPYVGACDICMMPSVADVAGLNSITRVVIGNAAHALAGMLLFPLPAAETARPLLGLTMFGVTTPCVEHVSALFEGQYEVVVFHATGTGGRAFEKLIDSGTLRHVIDVTLTEVCDLFMGGVMSAGPERLDSVVRTGIPYVGSAGALDMVNFAAMNTVPEKYRNRNLYVHNANVTLMRTTPEENAAMGRWIGEKLNQCRGPTRFVLPEGGVSGIDAPGQPFYDPEADKALFAALEATVRQTEERRIVRVPRHINDPGFAAALAEEFRAVHRNAAS